MNDFKLFKNALAYISIVPVLSGRNIILELSLKVDEKKTSFFFEEAEGRREKNLFFLRRPKVESSKVRFGPERTGTILLVEDCKT